MCEAFSASPFAQGVYALRGGGFQSVELLPQFAFLFGGHGLELLHECGEFALFAEYFDAEILDLRDGPRIELLHATEQIVDFIGHIVQFIALVLRCGSFYLLLHA